MNMLKAISQIFIVVFLVSGVAIAKEKVPNTISGTTKVSAEDVIKLIGEKDDLVIIDARAAKDRKSTGHIEGSIGLPDTETTPDELAKHISSKTTPIIVYCNGVKCGRSVKTSKMAVKEGYKNVYWFRGGWEEWASKGMPVSH